MVPPDSFAANSTSSSIWFRPFSLDELNDWHQNTLQQHVGIRFTEVGPDYLTATMPVDDRTKQPQGLLHGGANVVLAESLGSVGSVLCVDPNRFQVVGLEINANHLRAVTHGLVTGVARPCHLGRRTHVWEVRIFWNEQLSCISRITNLIKERPATR